MSYRILRVALCIGILLVAGLVFQDELTDVYAGRLIPGDSDGDGVPDSTDLCPGEDASFFDRDGDGCIDDPIGARHTEYWTEEDLPFVYVIQEDGEPDIGDGSDFTAIQNAFAAWDAVPGTDFSITYGGTVAQENADALDGINLVTFKDDEFNFPTAVLAVGISTSFTVDSTYNAKYYRPGQIVDADIIFNPAKKFKTPTAGVLGVDIQSVATHEAAHCFGIAHSPVASSTMFYVLPGDRAATSLETEDRLIFFKAYPDSAALADANRIAGTVSHGITGLPIPGAAVFAIDVPSGDTLAADYTLPDGSYAFPGLPDGSYYLSIYPLNQSSHIGYMKPDYVNALVETTAVTVFVPEYWDLAESNSEDPLAKDAVSVSGGSSELGIDFITNIDAMPPVVTAITPDSNVTDVRIDAVVKITFDEPIDHTTISGNFRLKHQTTGASLAGNVAVLRDDSVLAFTPTTPFDFGTTYELKLRTGLADKFGNTLPDPFICYFTTQPIPPLAITSLSPSKGVVGSIVVINGAGFGWSAAANIVRFGTAEATVVGAFPNRLVVTVPDTATTDLVTVQVGAETSNGLTFTVLSGTEVARGFESGVSGLNATPRSLTVLPDGSYAYVASGAGASAVVVDPGLASYLTNTPITIAGGLKEVDAIPTGKKVYGVSRTNERLYTIDSDPNHGPLFNTVIAENDIGAVPLGLIIEANRQRAFIPTDEGEIQVWDVNLQSVTYEEQIGVLIPPDPSVRGKMAIDPAGEYLLALTGAGKLLVYDLGPDSLEAQITVGPDPRDVIVDLVGDRAYVSDGTGNVTVVSLTGLFKVQDINTGGSLRGMTITPAGSYIYVSNRELDLLDVIDLREEQPTFRSVIATVPLSTNPIDVDLSPDGFYAFSLVENDQNLVVTTIGLGPTLKSISRRAGPIGTKLVLAGDGFSIDPNDVRVNFAGPAGTTIPVQPDLSTATALSVTVPLGTVSGPVDVSVLETSPQGDYWAYSNALYYQVLVLDPTDPTKRMRLAAKGFAPVDPVPVSFEGALALSPTGDFAVIGGGAGELVILDTDPNSPMFNQYLDVFYPATAKITDVAVTPDGKRAYLVTPDDNVVPVVNVNRYSSNFGDKLGYVDFQGADLANMSRLHISPDGEVCLISDWNAKVVRIIDIREGSTTENQLISEVPAVQCTAIDFHPGGFIAYLADMGPNELLVLDLNPLSGTYLTIVDRVGFVSAPAVNPIALSLMPDGSQCLVVTVGIVAPDYRRIYYLDTTTPDDPFIADSLGLEYNPNFYGWEEFDISPKGDRAVYAHNPAGFFELDLTADPDTVVSVQFFMDNIGDVDMDFVPDASRLYAVGEQFDSLYIFDFNDAQYLSMVGGNYQTGVINTPLPVPLRVRVTAEGGVPIGGVPITFYVVDGGGFFTDSGLQMQVVATDPDGYADIGWTLGPLVGIEDHVVWAVSEGLTGSPRVFYATAVEDPDSLPLRLEQYIPLPSTSNVSVTTAVQGIFSRGVDVSSIDDSTFSVRKLGDSTIVTSFFGFADTDRKVSLLPTTPLEYGTIYMIRTLGDILDKSGGNLENPSFSYFVTGAAPPPELTSVSPPSATVSVDVILAGKGFDPVPSNNTVLFNDEAAMPAAGSVDYLQVEVPEDAITGTVRVVVGSDTTNALPFTVLVPSTSPIDEVIASVGTGSTTKSIAVTPDGAMAYSVSPDGDVVIPIDIEGEESYGGISVGDNPVAIAIHPEGTYAYVANFNSNSVSVICIHPDSACYHTPVQTILVGTNPLDVAVNGDGDRIYVANAGSSNLSVIDGDNESSTHHQVIASVGTGSSARTIAVTPDGTRIYVGTDTGFVVIDAMSNAVIASVGTGSSARTIAVTPDGALMILLTTEGEVLIIDIEAGSGTENAVIASVGTGSTTRTIAVSPDGALLYLILEDSDLVVVYALEVLGSVGVIDPNVTYPPPTVTLTPVDSIVTGPNPYDIAFDPSGSGIAVITNAGNQTVTILNATGPSKAPVAAEIRVWPRILIIFEDDPDLRWWQVRYIRGWIELPPEYSPEDIDLSTVRLQDSIPALPWSRIVDLDCDGIEELKVKFDRVLFQEVLPNGWVVPVTITGMVNDRPFYGETTILTIRPVITFPCGGEILPPGKPTTISWDSPANYDVDSVDVLWTHDDGATWEPVALGIPDNGSVVWHTPQEVYDSCRVMVTLYSDDQDLGTGMSSGMFMISDIVAVALQNFSGVLEEDYAVLRWRTMNETGIEGFHVMRADERDGTYERITEELVPARQNISGTQYELRDENIELNRTYYYQVDVYFEHGSTLSFGPFEVTVLARFSLEQNVPNPFNPATTIRFTVPEACHVRLDIFDVAGRRVRSLIDNPFRAGRFHAVWDGTNDGGRRVASGVYFYRLVAGKHRDTKKMMLLR